MSPAATTPGAAASVSSVTIPSSTLRPEPSTHPVLGATPMPTSTTEASIARAVGEAHRLDPVGAVEAVDAHPEAEVDPVVAVQPGHDHAHLRAQGPLQRGVGDLQDGDLEAPGPAHGGHLGADEAGTHHDHALGLLVELAPQHQAVVERAQHVDALEHRARRAATGRRRRWR